MVSHHYVAGYRVSHGIPWYPMVSPWYPNEMPWDTIIYHGIPPKCYGIPAAHLGIPWYPMVSHGISWYPMVSQAKTSGYQNFHGIAWYPDGIPATYAGIPCLGDGIPPKLHGIPGVDLGIPYFFGIPWYPMVSRGIPWYPVVSPSAAELPKKENRSRLIFFRMMRAVYTDALIRSALMQRKDILATVSMLSESLSHAMDLADNPDPGDPMRASRQRCLILPTRTNMQHIRAYSENC